MAYGFGIVGCGMISTFHAQAIADVRGAKLVACFDTREAAAEKFAADNDCKAYTKLDAMLADPKVDIVTIAHAERRAHGAGRGRGAGGQARHRGEAAGNHAQEVRSHHRGVREGRRASSARSFRRGFTIRASS